MVTQTGLTLSTGTTKVKTPGGGAGIAADPPHDRANRPRMTPRCPPDLVNTGRAGSEGYERYRSPAAKSSGVPKR